MSAEPRRIERLPPDDPSRSEGVEPASIIERLGEFGVVQVVKIDHANPGTALAKAARGGLAVRFIATGGVSVSHRTANLTLPQVRAVARTWLATSGMISLAAFDQITRPRREAIGMVRQRRTNGVTV